MQQPQQQYAAGHIGGVVALAKLELMFSCTNLKNMVRLCFASCSASPLSPVVEGAAACLRDEF
jgi:hypothetical protein